MNIKKRIHLQMPMKQCDRQLVLKITAPGGNMPEALKWLLQLHKEGAFPVDRLPSVHIIRDMLLLTITLKESEIDPYLSTFSDVVENILNNHPLFPKGMDLEVADGQSTEYVQTTLYIDLPGGWRVCLLAEEIHGNIPDPDPHTIFLKARRAFGTGRHPSTTGAAHALNFLYEKGVIEKARLLDIGTGTAILAILAAKMGAAEVLGLDIDDRILADARENITLNRMSEKVMVSSSPIDALNLKNQDVIVANLTPSVLFKLLDKLVENLAMKGFLVLSGYRSRPGRRLRQMLQEMGLEQIHHIDIQGWSTEIFRFAWSKR